MSYETFLEHFSMFSKKNACMIPYLENQSEFL